MAFASSSEVVSWLKAAGESSRLRLLALCRERELSVSDLAHALRQSEPRVSRHLRILCEAGLLQRARQGQWVHYRLAGGAAAASFTQGLLGQLDRHDAQLAADRERIHTRGSQHSLAQAAESRLGRALQDFVAASLPDRIDSALIFGVEHPEVLALVASRCPDCVAIAHSSRAAQSARAFIRHQGLDCRVVLSADPRAVALRDPERPGQNFEAVILDHVAVPAVDLQRLLDSASDRLAPAGRIWLFERYEALESTRGNVVGHPLARLRWLLGQQGLSCAHLTPIEISGDHVLAAVAVRTAAVRAADSSASAPRSA